MTSPLAFGSLALVFNQLPTVGERALDWQQSSRDRLYGPDPRSPRGAAGAPVATARQSALVTVVKAMGLRPPPGSALRSPCG